MRHEGIYHSQFDTGTSNGSLSGHKGGQRWNWEHKIFDGVYDTAPTCLRPKYGALNYLELPIGGASRFGSAHLRLKPALIDRCTFAYPDSHLDPVTFGTKKRMSLIPMVEANLSKLDVLDNYIEAHIHGTVVMNQHVDAIVLDPSFQGTSVESEANCLPFDLEWHEGFVLKADKLEDCAAFRGQDVADFIQYALVHESLTPATLGRYRNGTVDVDVVKKAWHCLARYGSPSH